MNETVDIITKKNHEENLRKLDIPREVIPYLDIHTIKLVAKKISTITEKEFTYFGHIEMFNNKTLVKLSSKDDAQLIITIDHSTLFDEEGMPANNILFDGLNKHIDDKLNKEAYQEKINSFTSENMNKALDYINEDTNKQRAELEEIRAGKKKKVLLDVLGIEKDDVSLEAIPATIIETKRAIELSNTLELIKEENIKEKETMSLENKKRTESFLRALDNMNTTDDIKQRKKDIHIALLNKKLDKMSNGSI